MFWKYFSFIALTLSLTGCGTVKKMGHRNPPADPLTAFEQRAAKYHSVVTLPVFETTPAKVATTANQVIADGNAALDRIGQLAPGEVNFVNTIRALDDVSYLIQTAENRLDLIDQTSTNAAVRDAASDAIKKIDQWSVGMDYRADVYAAVKAYAATPAGTDRRGSKTVCRNPARLPPRRPGFAESPARSSGKNAPATDRAGNRF